MDSSQFTFVTPLADPRGGQAGAQQGSETLGGEYPILKRKV